MILFTVEDGGEIALRPQDIVSVSRKDGVFCLFLYDMPAIYVQSEESLPFLVECILRASEAGSNYVDLRQEDHDG